MAENGTPKRPATTGKAVTTAKSGLKAKPSLSSAPDRNRIAGNRNATEETSSNATVAALGKPRTEPKRTTSPTKESISSTRSTSPTKTSVGRRPILGSAEGKPAANRSSGKPTSTSTQSIRPPVTNSPRSTRPVNYSPQTVSRPAKKRLSLVSASASSLQKDQLSSTSVEQPPAMARKVRPPVGPRKSTLPATIEQRLRELSLVGTMLKAAMAEDGPHHDEVKEQYGRQVDEDLAMLRSKLEEARRNQGKEPLNVEDGVILPGSTEAKLHVENSRLKAELAASKDELSTVGGQLLMSHEREEEIRRSIETMKKSMNDREAMCSKLRNELVAAQAQADEAKKRTQEMSQQRISQLDDLTSTMKAEASARLSRLLNEQAQDHLEELDVLESELNKAKEASSKASHKAEQLSRKLMDFRESSEEQEAKGSQLLEEAECRCREAEAALNDQRRMAQEKSRDFQDLHDKYEESIARSTVAASRIDELQCQAESQMLELTRERDERIRTQRLLDSTQASYLEVHSNLQIALSQIEKMNKFLEQLKSDSCKVHETKEIEMATPETSSVNLSEDSEVSRNRQPGILEADGLVPELGSMILAGMRQVVRSMNNTNEERIENRLWWRSRLDTLRSDLR